MLRWLRIPLLLSASIAFSLLFMECAVRVVVPQQLIVVRPDVWTPEDGAGWRKRPHVDTTINTGEGTVRLRTDDEGNRIGEAGDFEGDVTVLLVGDSFMEALQVEYEESLAGRMEAGLAGARVLNSGVSGWGPSQYLIEARRVLAERPVDLVVVALYLGNDAESARTASFPPRAFVESSELRWPRSLSWAEVVDALLRPLNDALERTSHLFQLLKNANQALLIRLGLSARYLPTELIASPGMEAAWANTAESVRDVVALAQRHGAGAVVVVLPSHYQVVDEALELYSQGFDLGGARLDPALPNRTLARALAERGVVFRDAKPALDAAQAAGETVYGTVDTHLNPRGHAVVYEAIEADLRRALEGDRDAR